MLSHTFEQLFTLLVTAFLRYDDARRRPELVVELAAARRDLDRSRAVIARERARMAAKESERILARQTAVSDDELARLRVQGMGHIG